MFKGQATFIKVDLVIKLIIKSIQNSVSVYNQKPIKNVYLYKGRENLKKETLKKYWQIILLQILR